MHESTVRAQTWEEHIDAVMEAARVTQDFLAPYAEFGGATRSRIV